MGMYGVLCSLSPRRRELLDEEPELVSELIGLRRSGEVPGLLHLDKRWDALHQLLQGTAAADAILLQSGSPIGPDLAYGPARCVSPAVVAQWAPALPADTRAFVRAGWGRLAGVHGGYGRDGREDEDLADLAGALAQVRDLYLAAARDGHGMLAVVV